MCSCAWDWKDEEIEKILEGSKFKHDKISVHKQQVHGFTDVSYFIFANVPVTNLKTRPHPYVSWCPVELVG